MRGKVSVLLLCVLIPTVSLSARPLYGFSVNADGGVAPLIVFNDDSVGFHMMFPMWGDLSLESLTSVGFTLLGYVSYMTSTYPPTPSVIPVPWFHGSEELQIGFPVRIRTTGTDSIALRLHPLCLSATWTPFYYYMLGAGSERTWSSRTLPPRRF